MNRAPILFLTTDDFSVVNEPLGKMLCTNIPGFSLILFYTNNCKFCGDFIKEIKLLPSIITGCKVGLVNLHNLPKLVQMSIDTITPFKFVPYVLLYVNGRPFMRYDGDANAQSFRKFIMESAEKHKNGGDRTATSNNNNQTQSGPAQDRTIPDYTIAKPLSGPKSSKVCYINFDDYAEKK
jgi:hypothetical protein